MLQKIVLAIMVITVSGCSTYAVNRYSVSTDNVISLRALNGAKINIGEFTSSEPSKTEIMCRGVGPIKTPDGQTFENFIKKALTDELKIAEIYSTSSPLTLSGNLDAIAFSSNSGNWELGLTVKSTNGASISVTENYSYTTSFFGETACNQTAQALVPAVQNLIGKVVRNQEFNSLVN